MRIAVIVVAAAVCAAAFVPIRAQATLPLADVKLVAEKSVPFSEFATAQKNGTNGNRNGNKGNYSYFGFYGYGGHGGRRTFYGEVSNALSRGSDGELVAVELR
jgi:hypothetical protein